MFWIGFAIGLIIVLFVIGIVRGDFWDAESVVMGVVIIPFLAICLAFFGGVISTLIASGNAEVEYKLTETREIIAFKDNITGEGRSYLFSGRYEENLYYFYCEKTELGYSTEKIYIDNAYIQYTDKDFRIEVYEPSFVSETARVFSFSPIQDERYIIYIPEGSITEEYNIDLE